MAIVPKAEQYLDADLNVMLIGLHGVGKTEEILRLVKARGLKLKYYSCSTLDPYTDLVGVPVPVKDPETGQEYLKMIRPREVDEAEFIFFDEFNRADPKVHNAIFEIIQFGSINGEKLPNLKCVWAAMNPPGDDYKVEELDPALIDRFDVFVECNPAPSVQYMTNDAGLPKPIAQALYTWWKDHNSARRGLENYISPRRLVKIGQVYTATGDADKAIPKWITADRGKLKILIAKAEEDIAAKAGGTPVVAPKVDDDEATPVGAGANPKFTYEAAWLSAHSLQVAKYLGDNQSDLETHKAVAAVLEKRHAPILARDFAEVMDNLKPSLLEGFMSGMNEGRQNLLREKLGELADYRLAAVPKLKAALEM